jgi:hypothetical protein
MDNDSDIVNLAINLKVTGGPKWSGNGWKSRVKIEWVQDDKQPSEYSGGWLYFINK